MTVTAPTGASAITAWLPVRRDDRRDRVRDERVRRPRPVAEELLRQREHTRCIDVAGHDQRGVVWDVVAVLDLAHLLGRDMTGRRRGRRSHSSGSSCPARASVPSLDSARRTGSLPVGRTRPITTSFSRASSSARKSGSPQGGRHEAEPAVEAVRRQREVIADAFLLGPCR